MKFYMASDGNMGTAPLVFFDWNDVDDIHENAVDHYLEYGEFKNLVEYLVENDIPHQVLGELE